MNFIAINLVIIFNCIVQDDELADRHLYHIGLLLFRHALSLCQGVFDVILLLSYNY